MRLVTANVFVTVFALALVCSAPSAHAESDLEKVLRQQNAQTVEGYIQPVADLFGANMHAGFNHSASIPSSGFHFRFDIIGMAALIKSDQEVYRAPAPAGFGVADFETATVFGGTGSTITSTVVPALQYKGSDGVVKTSILPFATPQVTIGHIYGTEAVIRYVPIPEISSAGLPKITLFGIGVRHSISQYIQNSPLDLAFGVLYNSFTVGDLITVKGYALALQGSKEFSILILYGGMQYEKSTLTLSFNTTNPTATSPKIEIDLEGSNIFRATIGAGLNFGVVKLFADANFGAVVGFSGGIGFGF